MQIDANANALFSIVALVSIINIIILPLHVNCISTSAHHQASTLVVPYDYTSTDKRSQLAALDHHRDRYLVKTDATNRGRRSRRGLDKNTSFVKQLEPIAKSLINESSANETSCATSSSRGDRPAIYGIRCNHGCDLSTDQVITIKANEPAQLLLFGYRLDTSLSIALTPNESQAQEDCTHLDRISSLKLNIINPTMAQVLVDLPPPHSYDTFHLCLRFNASTAATSHLGTADSTYWFHQGAEPWLKLQVKQDFLPLFMKLIVIACLLALSGLFSGLNLGLMALDKNELQVILRCGSETEKRYAQLIEPVRSRGNYLLCTILFSNVLVNSTIAVFLEELTSGLIAVMTSTIFIVMFGEILPQAFCSRHGLAVGAKTVSITYLCMLLTFPLSYPVSSLLDWALGEEIGHAYDRERIKELIRLTGLLEKVEFDILSGALNLKKIHLSQVMTRIEDVFMIDMSSCLDFETIRSIIECGYSRIPVYESGNRKNIVALLFAKDLALLDPDDKTPVQTMINFYHHPVVFLFEDTTLDLALNEFKTGKSHMAFIRRIIDDGDRDPIYEITGVVTLEDVIEEIIQIEINDETDVLTDNRRKRRRKEAQVRRDFLQFTNIGGDSSYNIVTPQLCLAAYQYLVTSVEPFSTNNISDVALKRLLSQKIYYKVRADDEEAKKRLYTTGVPADYFIMILEGRVHVICGQENLIFDGGPFSHFGKSTLMSAHSDNLDRAEEDNEQERCKELGRQTLSTLDQSALKSVVNSTTGINRKGKKVKSNSIIKRRESIAGWTLSMKKLEHLVTDANDVRNNTDNAPVITSSPTLIAPTAEDSVAESSITESLSEVDTPLLQQTQSVSNSSHQIASPSKLSTSADPVKISTQPKDKMSGSHMIPDYTVDIITNSSYLKITRSEYLAAIGETLVECCSLNSDDKSSNENVPYDSRSNYLQAITSLAYVTNSKQNPRPQN